MRNPFVKESKNLQAEHLDIVGRLARRLDQYIADGRSTPGPRQVNDVRVTVNKICRKGRKK